MLQSAESPQLDVPPSPGPSNEAIDREVRNLKSIVAQQSRQLAAQGQALADLTAELTTLKLKLD